MCGLLSYSIFFSCQTPFQNIWYVFLTLYLIKKKWQYTFFYAFELISFTVPGSRATLFRNIGKKIEFQSTLNVVQITCANTYDIVSIEETMNNNIKKLQESRSEMKNGIKNKRDREREKTIPKRNSGDIHWDSSIIYLFTGNIIEEVTRLARLFYGRTTIPQRD